MKCKGCKKVFDTKYQYERHINRKTPCDKGDLQCPKCELVFNNRTLYNRHMNRKTPCDLVIDEYDNTKCRCIYCNRTYSTKSSLTRHLKVCKIKNGGTEYLAKTIHKYKANNNTSNSNIKAISSININNNKNSKINVNSKIVLKRPVILNFLDSATPKKLIDKSFTDDVKRRICMYIANNKIKKAAGLIVDTLHNNDDVPEGRNLFYSNTYNRYIIYRRPVWRMVNLDIVLDQLFIEVNRGMASASNRRGISLKQNAKLRNLVGKQLDKDSFGDDFGLIIEKTIQSIDSPVVEEELERYNKNTLVDKSLLESKSSSEESSSEESSSESGEASTG